MLLLPLFESEGGVNGKELGKILLLKVLLDDSYKPHS